MSIGHIIRRLKKRRAKDAERARRAAEFQKEFEAFAAMSVNNRKEFQPQWEDRFPFLDDRTSETAFDPHYVYHPAWAARVLARTRPAEHVDISSTLAFATLISAFMPVRFYDFRAAPITLSNLFSGSADLTSLSFEDDSIASLSCMHVLEHIGLGRYGDTLNPRGDLDAIAELKRVLAPGGNLLVAVPMGRQRIQFNAHRVYGFNTFKNYFDGLTLKEFALIEDGATPPGLLINPSIEVVGRQTYGCGCFWFQKPQNASP